jgi:hypothetical protein
MLDDSYRFSLRALILNKPVWKTCEFINRVRAFDFKLLILNPLDFVIK